MTDFLYDKKYFDPNEVPLMVNGSFINDDTIPFIFKGMFAYLCLPKNFKKFEEDELYEKVKFEISRDKFDKFINLLIQRGYCSNNGGSYDSIE